MQPTTEYPKLRLLLFNMVTDLDHPRQAFTHGWIHALAERVEWVHVITMWKGRVSLPGNVTVFSVGRERGYSEPRRAARFYRHLAWVLREQQPDVAFSHMIPVFTVMAAPLLCALGIPIVTWYLHPSLTLKLKLAHHLSQRVVSATYQSYPYKKDKLVPIGHGIDTCLFSPADVSPDDPPMILCAGRISPVKDQLTLLQAVRVLKDRFRHPFHVVILGAPAGTVGEMYALRLREFVQEAELQNIVRFESSVGQEQLAGWYRRCFVHVNLTPTGSGDKVALETMSCGRPSLMASEVFKDTLGKYASQLLFKHGDVEDLATHLNWVLSMSPTERLGMGEYLRERVIEQHDLSRLMDRLVSLFVGLSRGD